MPKMRSLALVAGLLAIGFVWRAAAQPVIPGCPAPGSISCQALQSFVPSAAPATLSATTSSGRVALSATTTATTGLNTLIVNGGTVPVFIVLGDVTVTATTGSTRVAAPGVPIIVPQGAATYLAGITGSSSATLTIYSGTGWSIPSGGTGGGGGPASAVTVADGADVAEGSTGDAAWSGSGVGTVVSIQKYIGAKIEAVRALLAGTLTVSGTVATTAADNAIVTLGAKADAKSTATDTTPITLMSVAKQISASVQSMVTSLAGTLSSNLAQIAGTTVSVNQGTPDAGTQRVVTAPTISNPTSTLTMTSATTAYTAGQNIATNSNGTLATVSSFAITNTAAGVMIPRLRLSINDNTSTAWGSQTIGLDLWTTAPTFAAGNGDRGTFLVATGAGVHIGGYTCSMSAVQSDGVYGECFPNVGQLSMPKLASGTSIFWTAQATTGSGVTGASKVVTLTAEVLN